MLRSNTALLRPVTAICQKVSGFGRAKLTRAQRQSSLFGGKWRAKIFRARATSRAKNAPGFRRRAHVRAACRRLWQCWYPATVSLSALACPGAAAAARARPPEEGQDGAQQRYVRARRRQWARMGSRRAIPKSPYRSICTCPLFSPPDAEAYSFPLIAPHSPRRQAWCAR